MGFLQLTRLRSRICTALHNSCLFPIGCLHFLTCLSCFRLYQLLNCSDFFCLTKVIDSRHLLVAFIEDKKASQMKLAFILMVNGLAAFKLKSDLPTLSKAHLPVRLNVFRHVLSFPYPHVFLTTTRHKFGAYASHLHFFCG